MKEKILEHKISLKPTFLQGDLMKASPPVKTLAPVTFRVQKFLVSSMCISSHTNLPGTKVL